LVVHAFGGPSEVHHALSAGLMVLSTWTGQDAVDMAIAGRRAAEDSRIPVLHLCEVAGDSVEAVEVPDETLSQSFLGERGLLAARTPIDATGAPDSGGSAGSATQRAPFALGSAMRDLSERTGRSLAPLQRFETLDAEDVIVTFGAAVPAALSICRDERRRARKIGLVGLRCLRPFLGPELVKATSRARTIAVLEPTPAGLCPSGRIAAELKSAFADALTWAAGYPGIGKIPNVISVSLSELTSPGAGQLARVLDEMDRGDRARRLVSL
jgi:pyruvate ferredoxin oxidoreductase alpha subunit